MNDRLYCVNNCVKCKIALRGSQLIGTWNVLCRTCMKQSKNINKVEIRPRSASPSPAHVHYKREFMTMLNDTKNDVHEHHYTRFITEIDEHFDRQKQSIISRVGYIRSQLKKLVQVLHFCMAENRMLIVSSFDSKYKAFQDDLNERTKLAVMNPQQLRESSTCLENFVRRWRREMHKYELQLKMNLWFHMVPNIGISDRLVGYLKRSGDLTDRPATERYTSLNCEIVHTDRDDSLRPETSILFRDGVDTSILFYITDEKSIRMKSLRDRNGVIMHEKTLDFFEGILFMQVARFNQFYLIFILSVTSDGTRTPIMFVVDEHLNTSSPSYDPLGTVKIRFLVSNSMHLVCIGPQGYLQVFGIRNDGLRIVNNIYSWIKIGLNIEILDKLLIDDEYLYAMSHERLDHGSMTSRFFICHLTDGTVYDEFFIRADQFKIYGREHIMFFDSLKNALYLYHMNGRVNKIIRKIHALLEPGELDEIKSIENPNHYVIGQDASRSVSFLSKKLESGYSLFYGDYNQEQA